MLHMKSGTTVTYTGNGHLRVPTVLDVALPYALRVALGGLKGIVDVAAGIVLLASLTEESSRSCISEATKNGMQA